MLLMLTALLVVVFLAASFWRSFAQKKSAATIALILKVVSGLGLGVIVVRVWVKILTHVFR